MVSCLKLTPFIGDGNDNKKSCMISGIFCLKLTPFIGDGNSMVSLSINDPYKTFKTNPVYRGRKLL